MSKQAVIEPAPAQTAGRLDEQATRTAAAGPDGSVLAGSVLAGSVLAYTGPAVADEALIAEELLVEEVSIDGMCGVY
jgi:mycofactocin precursor